jgi:hypothetical protein
VRFVVSTKVMRSQPQFTVRLSNWEPGARLSPVMFQFADLSGARRVQKFPVQCRPGSLPPG